MTVSTGGADWHGSAPPQSRSRRLSVCTVTIGACRIFRRNVNWRCGLRRSGCPCRSWFRSGCLRCLTRLSFPAGDIILLWRVGFDTFTTQSWFPKYFERTYGIDAAFDLRMLVKAGLVEIESAADSGFGDHPGAT